MDVFISHKQRIEVVQIPPSKSLAQRAILAATLCQEPVQIQGLGTSDDVLHFLEMSKKLGAKHQQINNDTIEIQGFKHTIQSELNAGESGLGLRLITSVCAVLGTQFKLTGEGSLLKRPMREFEAILPQLNINCETTNGFLPLQIGGQAKGGTIELDGSGGSQYLSGLLMALPLLKEDSKIVVNGLTSRPYIDLTLAVLADFGIEVSHENYHLFIIKGNQTYTRKAPYQVEGDYSGGSIWMVEGALKNDILLKGLYEKSAQGDKKMLEALRLANVDFQWNTEGLLIKKSTVKPFNFDATDCPDLFPALVVLAAAAVGESRIVGADRLIHKESNRAAVLVREFSQLGLSIQYHENALLITGNGTLKSGTIHSNNDHRIAMAGAISAGLTDRGILIKEAESVKKSYPNFWQNFDLQ